MKGELGRCRSHKCLNHRRIEADTLYRLLLVERAKDLEIHVGPEAVARATVRRIVNVAALLSVEVAQRQGNLAH